jgi:hypothetical protein
MSPSRWLHWTPKCPTIEKTPAHQPPKPAEVIFEGFEGATPAVSLMIEPTAPPSAPTVPSRTDASPGRSIADGRGNPEQVAQAVETACRCDKWPFPHIHSRNDRAAAIRLWNRESHRRLSWITERIQ